MNDNKKTTLNIIGTMLFGITVSVYAAELEEVTVTAQRKVESLQEVPIAISTLTRGAIEKTDTHELSGIAVQVPGLTFSAFSPGQNIVSIRGARSNDDGAGTDGSVVVFVDDVYLGRISNINPELFDLERIEVLRGPQGTLYGKNALGGVINIVSTRPNTERFESKVKVNIGNYSRRDFAALATGPINDNWAGKISVSHRERDGWLRNRFLNKDVKDDLAQGVRGQLLYTSDKFEALFSADYNRLDVEDMGRTPEPVGFGGGNTNAALFRTPYETVCGNANGTECTANPIDGYAKREGYGFSGKLSWDLSDAIELVSITAYRESEADWNMDSTGAPGFHLNDDIFDETEQFSQEFRLLHQLNDSMDYVAGLWYLNEETERTECFDLNGSTFGSMDTTGTPNTDCTPRGADPESDRYSQLNETNSFAVFGQLTWAFAPQWAIDLGVRYSYEEKEIVSNAQNGVGGFSLGIIAKDFPFFKNDENWSAFTPKVSLRYAVTDATNTYATYAQGFKSGGFQAAPADAVAAARVLDEEEADNYEIGIKSDLLSNLRINAALFYTEYEGLQYQNFGTPVGAPTGSDFGQFQTVNFGDAEVQGLELESTWLVTDAFSLSGFVAWTESEFGNTSLVTTSSTNQKGKDLTRTPELKYAINADYETTLSGGSLLSLSANYNFVDDQRATLPDYAVQPDFDLLDARINLTSNDERLKLTLWSKNLLDEEYITHIYTIAGGRVISVYGDPRMYGVTANVKF